MGYRLYLSVCAVSGGGDNRASMHTLLSGTFLDIRSD